MRLGELLALTISDIDFDNNMISITKSYQRIGKKDVITDPKTPNSKRKISVPKFLIADLEEYISSLYKPQKEARVFEITKYFLEHEMQRGIKKSGVKRIRIHDLRHSHASHLIHMGVPILEVSRRLGHQSPNITLVGFVRWRKGEDTQNFIISKQGINAPTNVGVFIRLLAVYTGASPLRPPFVFPDTSLIFPNNNTNFL